MSACMGAIQVRPDHYRVHHRVYELILGCSRCYHNFGTGVFGKQNYSGFNHDTWVYRLMDKHRKDVELTLKCSSKTAKERMESQVGCRYSCLPQLPYFDAV